MTTKNVIMEPDLDPFNFGIKNTSTANVSCGGPGQPKCPWDFAAAHNAKAKECDNVGCKTNLK